MDTGMKGAIIGAIATIIAAIIMVWPTPAHQQSNPTSDYTSVSTSTTGSISISSFPNGAGIYLDMRYQGTTPMTIRSIESGSYTITLKLTGYQDWSQVISVRARDTIYVSSSLISIPTSTPTITPKTGVISVHSTPDGATIYLDGINVGKTPKKISTEVGSHFIKLELKEYQDWSQMIQVAADLTSEVVSEMESAVYLIGGAALDLGETLDLDEGIDGRNNDIWYHGVSEYEHYIEPRGSASITRVGMFSVGRDGCMSGSSIIPRIPVETLKVGTYMCVLTDQGRYSEVRIDSVKSPGGTLVISVTTWKLTN